jgi:hypothetical protein
MKENAQKSCFKRDQTFPSYIFHLFLLVFHSLTQSLDLGAEDNNEGKLLSYSLLKGEVLR